MVLLIRVGLEGSIKGRNLFEELFLFLFFFRALKKKLLNLKMISRALSDIMGFLLYETLLLPNN